MDDEGHEHKRLTIPTAIVLALLAAVITFFGVGLTIALLPSQFTSWGQLALLALLPVFLAGLATYAVLSQDAYSKTDRWRGVIFSTLAGSVFPMTFFMWFLIGLLSQD
jgi:hypothetical protein